METCFDDKTSKKGEDGIELEGIPFVNTGQLPQNNALSPAYATVGDIAYTQRLKRGFDSMKNISAVPSNQVEGFAVEMEKDDDITFAGMSLNVLAQVASDRLEIDESRQTKKKPAKRAVQNMDRLDLHQIKGLSDKLMVSLFSDMTSDEIKKKYTLTCYLMPRTCQHQITVFGNEMKAKNIMRNHIRDHIEDLEKIKLEDSGAEVFSSEPVPARKKRLAAQYSKEIKTKKGAKKQSVGNMSKKAFQPQKQRRGRPPSYPQSLQDYADLGMDVGGDAHVKHAFGFEDDFINKIFSPKQFEEMGLTLSPTSIKEEELITQTVQELEPIAGGSAREEGARQAQEIRQQLADGSLDKIHPGVSTTLLKSHLDREQLIIDLMQKDQPFQDHNYTSILGKKRFTESMTCGTAGHLDEDIGTSRVAGRRMGADETAQSGTYFKQLSDPTAKPDITIRDDVLSPNSLSVPILRLPYEAVKTQNSSTPEELVLQELTRLAEKITQKSVTYRVNSTEVTDNNTRIPPDEALLSSEGEDEGVITSDANPHRRGRKGLENSSGEWERKAALKCIRELRIRKKDETTLVCKICKDKTFTATATLLYHYRSHAGIKPFVCLICNTTFTRQHSLNYHMLIHNNQSRFTCAECGRKFRHPSHFKEHMRRHTGETPYHCTDCPLRFKTRNTYKRHLRTRHDKLLTSCGIQKMSVEEVALNKAMQAYAIECQRPSLKEDGSTGEISADNSENEPKFFKTIAPKRVAQHVKDVSSSALAQALLTPIKDPLRRHLVTAAAPAASTHMTSHVTTVCSSPLPSISSAMVMQSAAAGSTNTVSFLQQTPLTCLTPINAGQSLILGQTPSLQQLTMVPHNGFLTIASQPTSIATSTCSAGSFVTMTQAPLMAVTPQPAAMATQIQQPLVALGTGHDRIRHQNMLLGTQTVAPVAQPILTSLQPVQLSAQHLTLASQGTQFMGMALGQGNILQPFQAFPTATQLTTGPSINSHVTTVFPSAIHGCVGPSGVAVSSRLTGHANVAQHTPHSMQFQGGQPSVHLTAGRLSTNYVESNLLPAYNPVDSNIFTSLNPMDSNVLTKLNRLDSNVITTVDSSVLATLNPVELECTSMGNTSAFVNAPDTPAARTLLKFCSQVVNQVGQVIPSSMS